MSWPFFWGLETPRWSTEGEKNASAASMAELPERRAMVLVGPPFHAREPSFGSELMFPIPE